MEEIFAINVENRPLNCNFALKKEAEKFFSASSDFSFASTNFSTLPTSALSEFAFIGRSNVGKSSLINGITKRRKLARVSITPGRTQQINFFKISHHNLSTYLVDLPGYGYAKAPLETTHEWLKQSLIYLKNSKNLQRTFVLIDARHGFKKHDLWFLKHLNNYAIPYQIILTKIDKSNKTNISGIIEYIKDNISNFPLMFPDIILTSSEKNKGVDILKTYIYHQLIG